MRFSYFTHTHRVEHKAVYLDAMLSYKFIFLRTLVEIGKGR